MWEDLEQAPDKCWLCPQDQWSDPGSSSCWPKSSVYQFWPDYVSVALGILSALGMGLTLFVLAVYVKHQDTPIVKTAGGLFYFNMAGLFCSFASVAFILGEPQNWKCKLRKPIFYISFAVCLSCMLAKTIRILCAFSSPLGKPSKLQTHLYLIIVALGPSIQFLICALWVSIDPPEMNVVYPKAKPYIILECFKETGLGASFAMGYLCFLAFCLLACTMRSQSLPSNFNEAQGVSFATIIFFVTWLSVFPVLHSSNHYTPRSIILALVILSSAHSFLVFLFFHNCYIILFKPECNTVEWIKKSTYEYCQKISREANLSIRL
uniref:Extracellular calcium-sensing receptor-like n=1 Tax=Geotrypetes seraphini TaxID=260995 RepID=A0A6P8R9C6_GEOSA|nr:extracellular calcium-sensing receptor-like [Geotrypetes seraphini]